MRTYLPGAQVLLGDVTGDGRQDLVLIGWEPARTTLLIRSYLPNGAFSAELVYEVPLPGLPVSAQLADTNEDGRLDVLLFYQQVPGFITLLSAPGGGFAWRDYEWIDKPATLTPKIFDADGDGHVDVITHVRLIANNYQHHPTPGHLVVQFGDGKGNFGRDRVMLTGGEALDRWTTGDFDGDGDIDLASAPGNTGAITWVRYNDGHGNFARGQLLTALVQVGAWTIAGGDVNSDGRDDLMVLDRYAAIRTFLQTSQGTLSNQPTLLRSGGAGPPNRPQVVDLNNDGLKDIVYWKKNAPQLVYMLQSPYGFQPAVIYNIAPYLNDGVGEELAAIGDLNGDGTPDMAVRVGSEVFLIYGKLTPYAGTGTLPGAPTIGAATLDPETASAKVGERVYILPIGPPASTGGNPITGYEVYTIPSGGFDGDVGMPTTSHRVSGLEDNRTYTFVARAITAAGEGPPSAPSPALVLGAVIDRDAPPQLSIAPGFGNEADLGPGIPVSFRAQLDKPAPMGGVTFSFATSNGTALAGLDYEAKAVTNLKIPDGEFGLDIYVPVIPDFDPEPDETMYVNFSAVSGAVLTTPTVMMTIGDNDGRPERLLVMDDLYVPEGDDTHVIDVPLALTSAAPTDVVFDVWSEPGYGGSYVTVDLKGVVIPAGQTRITVPLTVNGGTMYDGGKILKLWFLNAHGGDIWNSHGSAFVILNEDDPVPTLSIADVTRTEGNFGTTLMHFEVKLSAPTNLEVNVNAVTEDITTTGGSDYRPHYFAGLRILPGETSVGFNVEVHEDIAPEPDETFRIRLENPSHAEIQDDTAIATLLNDDIADGISVEDVQITEGSDGNNAELTVRLSQPLGHPVSFDLATGVGTAMPGIDFLPGQASLVIPAGQTTAKFIVKLIDDVDVEPTETIPVELRNVVGATPVRPQGMVRILNNDLPELTISGPTVVAEGNDGARTIDYVLRLSSPVSNPVLFDISHLFGSANYITDYRMQQHFDAYFDPGRTVYHHYVTVFGDTEVEADETGGFQVGNVRGAVLIGKPQLLFTIKDDDSTTVAARVTRPASVRPVQVQIAPTRAPFRPQRRAARRAAR